MQRRYGATSRQGKMLNSSLFTFSAGIRWISTIVKYRTNDRDTEILEMQSMPDSRKLHVSSEINVALRTSDASRATEQFSGCSKPEHHGSLAGGTWCGDRVACTPAQREIPWVKHPIGSWKHACPESSLPCLRNERCRRAKEGSRDWMRLIVNDHRAETRMERGNGATY